MKKLNLSNVNASGGFNAPKAGGYVCGVVDIIEKEEYQLFEVYLDIIEGEFKGYYTKAIKEGHRKQLQKFTIFYKDEEKLGTLMGFLTSVKESNTGFNFDAKAVTSPVAFMSPVTLKLAVLNTCVDEPANKALPSKAVCKPVTSEIA